MVHFYHAVSDRELHVICSEHVQDIEDLLASLLTCIAADHDQGEDGGEATP